MWKQFNTDALCKQARRRLAHSTASVRADEPLARILHVQSAACQLKHTLRPRHFSPAIALLDTVLGEPSQRVRDTWLEGDRQQPGVHGRER